MRLFRDKGILGIILGILVAVAVGLFQSVGWERLLPLLAVAILSLVYYISLINVEDRI